MKWGELTRLQCQKCGFIGNWFYPNHAEEQEKEFKKHKCGAKK